MARSWSGTTTRTGWTTAGPPRPWPCLPLPPLSLSLSAQAGDASPTRKAEVARTSARSMKKASPCALLNAALVRRFRLDRSDPEGLWQNGDLEWQAAHHLAVEIDQGLHVRGAAEGGAARRPHLGMADMVAAVELGQDAQKHAQAGDVAHLDQVEHAIVETRARQQLH